MRPGRRSTSSTAMSWTTHDDKERTMTVEHPILMTGGSSGVGAATARQLLERGHRVVSLDVQPSDIPDVDHRDCDLSDPATIAAVAAGLEGPYSALLNIAGVPGTVGAELTMKVNVFGLRLLTDLVWDRLADGGAVINVASIAGNNWRKRRGYIADVLATQSFADGVAWWAAHGGEIDTDAYTFSKEAVVVYTMQLAGRGLARNICVNDVGPGPVKTPIFPDFTRDVGEELMQQMVEMTGRAAQPEDIAEALVVLAERQIGWLNGQHVIVDGGMTAGYSAGWKS
jgi:NAD(P)-dependent dehydrogenase (short-subunit alcohol dehydrogenase family)